MVLLVGVFGGVTIIIFTNMANRTLKDAKSIKGTNPQYLVEKIIRTRIYDCQYWKEECFALTGEQDRLQLCIYKQKL